MAFEAFEILGNGETKRVKAEDEAKLGKAIYGQKEYVCCGTKNGKVCLCPVKIVATDSEKIKPYFKPKNKRINHIPNCSNYQYDENVIVKTINYNPNAYGDCFNIFETICFAAENTPHPGGEGPGHTDEPEIEIETPEKHNTKDIKIRDKKLTTALDVYEFLAANIDGTIPYKDDELPTKTFIYNRDTFADFKRGTLVFDGYRVVFAGKWKPDDEFIEKHYDSSMPIFHLFDIDFRNVSGSKYNKIAFQLYFSSLELYFKAKDKYFFTKADYKRFLVVGDWKVIDENCNGYLVCRCYINNIKQITPATQDIIDYEK